MQRQIPSNNKAPKLTLRSCNVCGSNLEYWCKGTFNGYVVSSFPSVMKVQDRAAEDGYSYVDITDGYKCTKCNYAFTIRSFTTRL